MQSHDSYCFLPMTSLLLQPYHPRKDAIKKNLWDWAKWCGIAGKQQNSWKKLISRLLSCCRPRAPALSGRVSAGKAAFSASRGFAGAEAACWLCADPPPDSSARNAARRSLNGGEGPLSLCFAMAPSGFCRILDLREQPSSSSRAEGEQL